MKKQTLLAAVAIGTIAVAGAANASDITAGKIANKALDFTTSATLATSAYSLASELDFTTAINIPKTNSDVTLTVSAGQAELLANSYVVTFKTTGAEFKLADVAAGDLTATTKDAGCTVAPTVSTLAANEVSFLVTASAGCSVGKGVTAFTFKPSLNVKAAGSTSITGGITLGGVAVDGGTSKAVTIVDSKAGFATTITAAADSVLALTAPAFTTFKSGGALGTIAVNTATYTPADVVYKDGAGTAVAAGDISGTIVEITRVGATNTTIKVEGVAATDAAVSPLSFKLPAGAIATANNVVATITDSKVATTAGTFSATVKVDLGTGFIDPAATTKALGSIVRDGTAYLIPWVGSGTTAQASGNATVIRISNISTTATGLVSAELLTASTGAGVTTSLIPINGTIAAGKDFVITGASLQSNFGADFGRGDVRITVEAPAANLVTRRFIQNVANGSLTEVSLGRTAGGVEPQN